MTDCPEVVAFREERTAGEVGVGRGDGAGVIEEVG
jgi:hypothetical protein